MIKTRLKDGYVKYPESWIVLNEKDSAICSYAGVVEVRANGVEFPHFLFFSTIPIAEMSDEAVQDIYQHCCDAYPAFAELLLTEVTPIWDEEGHLVNATEWISAPHPGCFAIYCLGNPNYPADYQPPYGAMIIPN